MKRFIKFIEDIIHDYHELRKQAEELQKRSM